MINNPTPPPATRHTNNHQPVTGQPLDSDAPCTRHELPDDVGDALLRLMDELGLVFGTVDFKVAENGEHVFLEVNPQGQFLYT